MISEIGLEAALASGAGAVELVPCDTEGLVRVADILRRHAEVLDAGGWSLSCVEVTSWRGPASEGFWSVIEVEAARWRSAAEAFRSGALAVNGFVAAVAPARDVAAQAVTVYRAYEGAMAAATALADPGVPAVLPLLAVGVRIEAMQRAQASAGAGLVGEAEALRRHAVALLAAARAGVEAAGDLATDALTRAAEAAPEARRFWDSTIRPAAVVGTGHAALDWAGMAPGVAPPRTPSTPAGTPPRATGSRPAGARSRWRPPSATGSLRLARSSSSLEPSMTSDGSRRAVRPAAPDGSPPTRSTAPTPWRSTLARVASISFPDSTETTP